MYCQQYNIGITTKLTDLEHTKKIGYSSRINIKLASISWYKKKIEEQLDISEGIIKVRKEVVYQQNYKSKCLVIYSILSQ